MKANVALMGLTALGLVAACGPDEITFVPGSGGAGGNPSPPMGMGGGRPEGGAPPQGGSGGTIEPGGSAGSVEPGGSGGASDQGGAGGTIDQGGMPAGGAAGAPPGGAPPQGGNGGMPEQGGTGGGPSTCCAAKTLMNVSDAACLATDPSLGTLYATTGHGIVQVGGATVSSQAGGLCTYGPGGLYFTVPNEGGVWRYDPKMPNPTATVSVTTTSFPTLVTSGMGALVWEEAGQLRNAALTMGGPMSGTPGSSGSAENVTAIFLDPGGSPLLVAKANGPSADLYARNVGTNGDGNFIANVPGVKSLAASMTHFFFVGNDGHLYSRLRTGGSNDMLMYAGSDPAQVVTFAPTNMSGVQAPTVYFMTEGHEIESIDIGGDNGGCCLATN